MLPVFSTHILFAFTPACLSSTNIFPPSSSAWTYLFHTSKSLLLKGHLVASCLGFFSSSLPLIFFRPFFFLPIPPPTGFPTRKQNPIPKNLVPRSPKPSTYPLPPFPPTLHQAGALHHRARPPPAPPPSSPATALVPPWPDPRQRHRGVSTHHAHDLACPDPIWKRSPTPSGCCVLRPGLQTAPAPPPPLPPRSPRPQQPIPAGGLREDPPEASTSSRGERSQPPIRPPLCPPSTSHHGPVAAQLVLAHVLLARAGRHRRRERDQGLARGRPRAPPGGGRRGEVVPPAARAAHGHRAPRRRRRALAPAPRRRRVLLRLLLLARRGRLRRAPADRVRQDHLPFLAQSGARSPSPPASTPDWTHSTRILSTAIIGEKANVDGGTRKFRMKVNLTCTRERRSITTLRPSPSSPAS